MRMGFSSSVMALMNRKARHTSMARLCLSFFLYSPVIIRVLSLVPGVLVTSM